MSPLFWKSLTWAAFGFGLLAHVFLFWDAANINDLKARVSVLEQQSSSR